MAGKVKKNVSLLVHACDRYKFLFKGFEIFFNRFFDKTIQTNLYFATELIDIQIDSFTNIRSGTGEWSDRLKRLLIEKIEEEYILYIQEDMWFLKAVDGKVLNELMLFVIENNIDCVKLHSSEVYQVKPTERYFGGLNLGRIINEDSRYLMSHQITLWKKSFLLQQLKKNEHPWRNEKRGTKRLKKLNPVIYHIDLFSENGKEPINTFNTSNEGRSLYFTVSTNSVFGDNIVHYFDLLALSSPEYLAQVKDHYENQLTHDGKVKPRKDDIFKKIKKWL